MLENEFFKKKLSRNPKSKPVKKKTKNKRSSEYSKKKQKLKDERKKQNNRKRKDDLLDWYRSVKSKCFCYLCGDKRSEILEYHHLQSEDKLFSISNGIKSGLSKEKIKTEMDKCICLCPSCHRSYHLAVLTPSEVKKYEKALRDYAQKQRKKTKEKKKTEQQEENVLVCS